MTKASGSIDLNSLKVAGEPNKYITYITNEGIRIHDANSSTTNFVKINSNGMQIYKGGTADSNKVAQFGSTINLYKPGTTDSLVTIDSNGASFTGTVVANAGSIGGTSGWTIASQQIYSTGKTIGNDDSMFLSTKNLAGTVAGTTLTTTAPSWRLTVGSNFGVDNTGKLYASNGKFNGRIEATEGYIANTITIGNGGTALSTVETNAKQSQVYTIGVNNGTTGYHFLGTLTLSSQTAEAEIEIHTGDGQNNGAYQNLTIRVNIKRGYQPTTAATAGITVRYEGDPTVVTIGESNCSIIARCTEVGVLNIYMYTPNWGYADGWYQVKGRDWTWVHRGTILTTAPSEGTAQTISTMNPYTTATNYITKIDESGIFISPANQSPTLSTPGNSTRINATGMEVFKGSISVAKFGETTRIGEENNNNILIQSDGIVGADSNKTEYFSIKYDKFNPITTETGIINTSYRIEGPITTTTYSLQKTEKLINPVSNTTISFGVNRIYTLKLPDNLSISSNSVSNCTLDTYFLNFFREAYIRMNDFTFTVGTSGSRIMQAQITLSNSAIINFKLTISYNGTTNIITFTYEESATQTTNLTWHDFDQPGILYNGSCCPSTFQFGINNMVSGSFSAGLGQGIKLTGANQFACGKYNNITSNNLIFMVGDGEAITSRRNAFTVSNEGNAYVRNEITVGNQIRTNGYIVAGGLLGSSYARNGAIIATDVFYSINGLVTDGTITATGNINTNGNFTRNGNSYIVTEEHSVDNKSIAASGITTVDVTMTKTNYTLLGTVSIGMANATSNGARVGNCTIRNFDMSGNTVTVAVYNNSTSAAKIKVIVRGLYRAN